MEKLPRIICCNIMLSSSCRSHCHIVSAVFVILDKIEFACLVPYSISSRLLSNYWTVNQLPVKCWINLIPTMLCLLKKASICPFQGFVEDQFGLGLIARAIEEGISIIKPLGIMIFNMGGRPGQAVCKRLFERRGLQVNKLWQTKVLQVGCSSV